MQYCYRAILYNIYIMMIKKTSKLLQGASLITLQSKVTKWDSYPRV